MATKSKTNTKSTVINRPFSVRMTLADIETLEKESAQVGYSSSQFADEAVRAIITMINQPTGHVTMPRLVAMARFLKSRKAELIPEDRK